MARKTNINNLTIVWQGQSWSVLAPNGRVLARFFNKGDAVRYAKRTTTYISDDFPPDDYLDDDFIEYKVYIFTDHPSEDTAGVYGYNTNFIFSAFNGLSLAKKVLILALASAAILIIGRQVIVILQTGIAQVDWGALVVQCIVAIGAVIAAMLIISVVGGIALALITIAAAVVGFALACGVITSLVFHWPWSF